MLYPLCELLLCCLVGVLSGANGWVEVEEYSKAKLDFLRRFLPFEHGVASHDTFSDVVNALDRSAFAAAFIAWVQVLQGDLREIIAIDGKTLRRSSWGVENGLHWTVDIVFREDECRIRSGNGPATFATFRHMAINLLQRTQTPKRTSIRVKRGLAAISKAFLAQVLTVP